MPMLKCVCDQIIHYGEIPCQDEWLMISDVKFDKFSGSTDSETIYKQMTHLLKCPNCCRLHIFWDGFGNPPQVYLKEQHP